MTFPLNFVASFTRLGNRWIGAALLRDFGLSVSAEANGWGKADDSRAYSELVN